MSDCSFVLNTIVTFFSVEWENSLTAIALGFWVEMWGLSFLMVLVISPLLIPVLRGLPKKLFMKPLYILARREEYI